MNKADHKNSKSIHHSGFIVHPFKYHQQSHASSGNRPKISAIAMKFAFELSGQRAMY